MFSHSVQHSRFKLRSVVAIRQVFIHRRIGDALLIGVLLASTGCQSGKSFYRPAQPVSLKTLDATESTAFGPAFDEAATAYAAAVKLDEIQSSDCIAGYYRCATILWPQVAADQTVPVSNNGRHIQNLYDSAVGRLVESAIRFGRFDPNNGKLIFHQSGEQRWLPVRYQGFPWEPHDFAVLEVVGACRLTGDAPVHQQAGLGVPLLVRSAQVREFGTLDPVFPATAIVHPAYTGQAEPFVLDMINPLVFREVSVNAFQPGESENVGSNRSVPIAFNLSAHFAYLETTKGEHGVDRLLRPAKHDETEFGLRMAEPFQAGKIPVVFIHGLASSEIAWHPMLNEILTHPDLVAKYQFWVFAYRTGLPFPQEAEVLRAELVKLRNLYDPQHQDPSLDQIVLVGHSMGGLLAKLQVTTSTNQIARAIFQSELEQVDLPAETKSKLRSRITFEASDQVARVIFIGTPHQGSRLADGSLGQIGSRLAKMPEDALRHSEQILESGVGIRNPAYKRVPKSVDLLRSDDPVLAAVFRLPVADRVHLHSIIGAGHKTFIKRELTDGVVPVSSARHPGTESELLIDANHYLHTHTGTIDEVIRILRSHSDNK